MDLSDSLIEKTRQQVKDLNRTLRELAEDGIEVHVSDYQMHTNTYTVPILNLEIEFYRKL